MECPCAADAPQPLKKCAENTSLPEAVPSASKDEKVSSNTSHPEGMPSASEDEKCSGNTLYLPEGEPSASHDENRCGDAFWPEPRIPKEALQEASRRCSPFQERDAAMAQSADQAHVLEGLEILEFHADSKTKQIWFGAYDPRTGKYILYEVKIGRNHCAGQGVDGVYPCTDLFDGSKELVVKCQKIPQANPRPVCSMGFKISQQLAAELNKDKGKFNKFWDDLIKCLDEALGTYHNFEGDFLKVYKPTIHDDGSVTVDFKLSVCEDRALLRRYRDLDEPRKIALSAEHGINIKFNVAELPFAKDAILPDHLREAAESLKKIFPEEHNSHLMEMLGKARQIAIPGETDPTHPAHIFARKATEFGFPLEKVWVSPLADSDVNVKHPGAQQLAKIYSEREVCTSKVTQRHPNIVEYVHVISTQRHVFSVMTRLPKNLPEVTCPSCNCEVKDENSKSYASSCAVCRKRDQRNGLFRCRRCQFDVCQEHFQHRKPLGILAGDMWDILLLLRQRKPYDSKLIDSWRTVCPRVCRQTVEAVHAFHEEGFRHMDIKVENFHLWWNTSTGETQVTLLDLGVSVSSQNLRPGWSGYIDDPPAKTHGGALPAISTDVFRLLLTIFFLICHARPWWNADRHEVRPAFRDGRVIEMIMREYNDLLGVFPHGSDAELREMLKKALDKDPTKRPTTAEILNAAWLRAAA